MALHKLQPCEQTEWTHSGLGHWRAHKEVLSRTVHAKLTGTGMPNARVSRHGVALQMPHKKSTKNGVEKIANWKDTHLNK